MLANDQSQYREGIFTVDGSVFKSKICDIPSFPFAEANCLEFSWFSPHLFESKPWYCGSTVFLQRLNESVRVWVSIVIEKGIIQKVRNFINKNIEKRTENRALGTHLTVVR